jgi:signal transduction histidine kinase
MKVMVDMAWLAERGLQRKFLLGTLLGLSVLSLLMLGAVLALYRQQLSLERSQASREVNRLLQITLENAMLKRDLPGLREVIERLGQQKGVLGAMIVSPQGEIRFASDRSKLGQRFALDMPGLCLHCTPDTPEKELLTLFQVEAGREVMRSLNPVANKAACSGCHGDPAAHPVNGVLVVDYDAEPIRRQAAVQATWLAGLGGVLLALTLIGGGWFIRRNVLQPVSQMADACRGLAKGDLDSRVQLAGSDELTDLGRAFNQMAENLQVTLRRNQEQENFMQALVDAIPDGVRVIDTRNFEIALDNKAYRAQIGVDASHCGHACHASSHGLGFPCPPTLIFCPVHEIKRNPQTCKTLMEFKRPNGGRCKVEVIAAPLQAEHEGRVRQYVVESSRDLGQLLQFSQEQRLAEMARLATGVAHEIHNPLASIRIALHATLRAIEADGLQYGVIGSYLKLVDGEIDRCIEVTERLLKLGATPSASAQLVEVNPAIEETLSLLAWEAVSGLVVLDIECAQPSPRVLATDSELRMVVLNLAQNALHAMPSGGRLRVSAQQQSAWVEIVFEDTGVGIDAADMPHIFEPFYSRRADGSQGTGLGLAICQSIIESYGGHIRCVSSLGEGSRFVVELPDAASQLDAS